MVRFTIDWKNKKTGREFTTEYTYDGCDCQKGYSITAWTLNCLHFGWKNGFSADTHDIKLVNPKDYPEFTDRLFQPVTENGDSLPSAFAHN